MLIGCGVWVGVGVAVGVWVIVGELVTVIVADGLGVTDGVTCTTGSPPVSGKDGNSSVLTFEQEARTSSRKSKGNQKIGCNVLSIFVSPLNAWKTNYNII
jgi:hypothetical protein